MAKQFIYASDLSIAKSVIGLLDGSEQFCFENPYFNVKGIPKPDLKTFLEIKSTMSKFGVMLNHIAIWLRGNNGVFTKYYSIGYTSTERTNNGEITKQPKEYYVRKPFDTSGMANKMKHKLSITPVKGNIKAEDINLVNIDYQFSMVMDVLCAAKVMNVNLSKYKGMDNPAFYRAFIDDLNAILTERGYKKLIDYDEALVSSFTNAPIFGKSSRNELIPIYDAENADEPAFKTFFTAFYEAITSIKSKPKGWEKVFARANCVAFPTFRFIDYEKKVDDERVEHVKLFDTKLSFNVELSSSDPGYNPKFPDSLISKQQLNKSKIANMTLTSLSKLWGGALSDDEKVNGAVQRGCFYISPHPRYGYFEKGSPTIEWRVDKVVTHRVESASNTEDNEGAEFLDDASEDEDIMPRSTSEPRAVGNEDEIDPDML